MRWVPHCCPETQNRESSHPRKILWTNLMLYIKGIKKSAFRDVNLFRNLFTTKQQVSAGELVQQWIRVLVLAKDLGSISRIIMKWLTTTCNSSCKRIQHPHMCTVNSHRYIHVQKNNWVKVIKTDAVKDYEILLFLGKGSIYTMWLHHY